MSRLSEPPAATNGKPRDHDCGRERKQGETFSVFSRPQSLLAIARRFFFSFVSISPLVARWPRLWPFLTSAGSEECDVMVAVETHKNKIISEGWKENAREINKVGWARWLIGAFRSLPARYYSLFVESIGVLWVIKKRCRDRTRKKNGVATEARFKTMFWCN